MFHEQALNNQGLLTKVNSPSTLTSQISRIQNSHLHVLESAYACSQHLQIGRVATQDLESALTFGLNALAHYHGKSTTLEENLINRSCTLLIPMLRSTPVLQNFRALWNNVMNPFISKIVILVESGAKLTGIPQSPKISKQVVTKISFQSILMFMNSIMKMKDIVIIGNIFHFCFQLLMCAVQETLTLTSTRH